MVGLLDLMPEGDRNAQLNDAVAYGGLLDRQAKRKAAWEEFKTAAGDSFIGGLVKSAIGAAALPGDVYAGRVDPTSEVGIQRAADLAGFTTLGSFAAPRPAGSVGMGGRPAGIRAYHGSPHDFDRFDMSKIGTGEGAQAYGHGLYFAENEAVAKGYRDSLSGVKQSVYSQGAPLDFDSWAAAAARNLDADAKLYGFEAAKKSQLDDLTFRLNREMKLGPNGRADEIRQAIALVQNATPDTLKIVPESAGRMYEVNIRANPDEFLDWDKPLAQQPQILDRLREYGGSYRAQINRLKAERDALAAKAPQPPSTGDEFADLFAGSEWQGWAKLSELDRKIEAAERAAQSAAKRGALFSENLNHDFFASTLGRNVARAKTSSDADALLGIADDRQLASTLRDIGIPGVRYLDQGSRGVGEGSRNYVVFDDALIEIIRKYGLAGLLGGGAAAQGGVFGPAETSQ